MGTAVVKPKLTLTLTIAVISSRFCCSFAVYFFIGFLLQLHDWTFEILTDQSKLAILLCNCTWNHSTYIVCLFLYLHM